MLDFLEPFFVPLGYIFGYFGLISDMSLREFFVSLAAGGFSVPNIYSGSTFFLPGFVNLFNSLLGALSSGGFWIKFVTAPIKLIRDIFSAVMYALLRFTPSFILDMPFIVAVLLEVFWFVLVIKFVKLILSFIPFFGK